MKRWPRTTPAVGFIAGLLACFIGCSDQDPPTVAGGQLAARAGQDGGAATKATTGQLSQSKVSAPFDVGAVIQRVHLAFRQQHQVQVFSARHTSHSVQVDPQLNISVTPAHYPSLDPTPGQDPDAVHRRMRDAPHQRKQSQAKAVQGSALVLRTLAVRRGTQLLTQGARAARVAGDGSLGLRRGQVVERLRNSVDGVEQSWELAARPAGAGDLVVQIAISGQPYSGQSATGLHFKDPTTGVGLRYGHATWVDATGRRTPVRARHLGGKIVLRVPAAVVDHAAYPAVLDPLISPQFGMDKAVTSPAWASQTAPSVAHDGTNYMVVWHDGRDASASQTDIWGARVDASGKLLDPTGFVICQAVNNQHNPHLAYGSGTFFVAWRDYRNNTTYPDIYGARVSTAGKVQDPGGIPISVAAYYQYEPHVVFGGGQFFVVWYDYRTHPSWSDVYGARIKPDGTVLDKSGIAISKAYRHQHVPTAAYDGTNFMVVWYDYRHHGSYPDIYGARVSAAGKLLDTSGIRITKASYYQYSPHLTYLYNGSAYLVVWRDYRHSRYSADIYGARVSAAGKLLDTSGIAISRATNHQYEPRVAQDGSGFMVAWQDYRNASSTGWDIYGSRVTSAGKVLDTSGLLISAAKGHQQVPDIVYSGKEYFTVWSDARGPSKQANDIYGARISASGTVKDTAGVLISAAANTQAVPAVAHDGSGNYLVVWEDQRNLKTTGTDLYGVLVDGQGKVQTPSGIKVSGSTGNQVTPAAAYGGNHFLVVWSDSRSGTHIYGTQVETSGKVRQPTGFPLTTGSYARTAPALAFDGTNFLVTWTDNRNGNVSDIYGALVNQYGGKTSSSDIAIAKLSQSQQNPAVAYSKGSASYMVLWQDYRNTTKTYWDIYGARVSTAGKVLDPKGIAVSTTFNHEYAPDVAFDGTNYLAVWYDLRNAYGTSYDIYGARISAAGKVLEPQGFPIAVASEEQTYPQVAFSGADYLVVWDDRRNGKYNKDVYGTMVSTSGKVASPLGLGLANAGRWETGAAVASGGGGSFLVSYSQVDLASGGARVKGRIVSAEKGAGEGCTAGKQCKSGFCVDGVCCDAACGNGDPTDCQACAVAKGGAKDGACGPVKGGALCRGASGVCDLAETCDGTSLSCPADGYQPNTKVCRGALGSCDEAETCDGSSAQCPGDGFKAPGSICRAALGACDLGEACDGSSAKCPVDTFIPSSKECRPAAGLCDVAENCTGSTATCPADSFKAATEVCRKATGGCDQDEKCSGAAGKCPADLFKLDGSKCATGVCQAGKCQTLPDAGIPDTMATPDQSKPDMGQPDMGQPDSGKPDMGQPDKTPIKPDQKVEPPAVDEGGCSVAATQTRAPGWLALLALALLLRRTRR